MYYLPLSLTQKSCAAASVDTKPPHSSDVQTYIPHHTSRTLVWWRNFVCRRRRKRVGYNSITSRSDATLLFFDVIHLCSLAHDVRAGNDHERTEYNTYCSVHVCGQLVVWEGQTMTHSLHAAHRLRMMRTTYSVVSCGVCASKDRDHTRARAPVYRPLHIASRGCSFFLNPKHPKHVFARHVGFNMENTLTIVPDHMSNCRLEACEYAMPHVDRTY